MKNRIIFSALAMIIAAGSSASAAEKKESSLSGSFSDPYYKERPQFHFYPDPSASIQKLKRVGPIGIGLDLLQPAFTMRINNVEPGSPAEKAGLKKGHYIQSINGRTLRELDPRIILGDLITETEATDGKMRMMIKDGPEEDAKEVIVQLEVFGAYSDTWPINCTKSDKIVRKFADFLAAQERPGWGAPLFLLSTGEEKDLDVVRKWFTGKGNGVGYPWTVGYTGPALCEYYLRTGDQSVLPNIKEKADYLTKTIYNGGWAGRGSAPYRYMAGGHMNAAGVHCVTFLMLAKECGVDVDEHTLQSALKHFYRYAGHSNVSYGDGLPEGGGVDNGKNGGLAFAMAAAVSLHPDGEQSVYAKARDISANKSFYTTSWLFHGHTGGGIGELWRGAAMALLADKRPEAYHSFNKERRWMYDLARTWDGALAFNTTQNGSYDGTGHGGGGKTWGNYVGLVYTVPRKKLRIYGAPPTRYSKTYEGLPDRPWGNSADEMFYSLESGEYKPGKRHDMQAERLPTSASWPLLQLTRDPAVSDETLLALAHHPDSTARGTAAGAMINHGRRHLILGLLKSGDTRARHAGAAAIGNRKHAPEGGLQEDEVDLLIQMVNNEEEAWYTVRQAMQTLQYASADQVERGYDRLLHWLKHDDWWMRHGAMTALTPLAVHTEYYKDILPVIGRMVASNQRAVALSPLRNIVALLSSADPEVQSFAVKTLGQSYADFPNELFAPGGQNLDAGLEYLLDNLARNLSNTPGGFDALYDVSRKRFPKEALPHKPLYMSADANTFGPKVKEALKPIVLDYLIPKHIGAADHSAANSDLLLAAMKSEPYDLKSTPGDKRYDREFNGKATKRATAVDGLVDLYNRIGVSDYNWQLFGPDMTGFTWHYHSFDPKEEKLWGGTRYRDVSVPAGMENWFAADFDAAVAGWKNGKAPFGQNDGRLELPEKACEQPFCRCAVPLNTLWEKEVMLMQSKVTLPPLREGHRYRLVVGGMSHVNKGEGFNIYVNGKLMMVKTSGTGKRAGGKPICYYIEKDRWPDFEKEATVSVMAFLQHNKKTRHTQQHFNVFFQEMKMPPITDDMIIKGKTLQPLISTKWQDDQADDNKYLYDGTFKANAKMIGDWTALGTVASVDLFGSQDELDKASHSDLVIKGDGKTSKELVMWTDDTLMEFNTYEALKMVHESIDGKEHLFIENGGFSRRHKPDWKSSWTVFGKR